MSSGVEFFRETTAARTWAQSTRFVGSKWVRSCEPRHRVSVHTPPVAERIGSMGSLQLETKTSIQANGRSIIDVHRELQTPDAKPVVRGIEKRCEKSRSDAAPGTGVVNTHPESSYMRLPPGESVEPSLADKEASFHGDQVQISCRCPFHPPRDFLGRMEGTAHRSEAEAREVDQIGNGFRIRRPARPDNQAVQRRRSPR